MVLEECKIKIATQILNLANNDFSVTLLAKLDGYLNALSDFQDLEKNKNLKE